MRRIAHQFLMDSRRQTEAGEETVERCLVPQFDFQINQPQKRSAVLLVQMFSELTALHFYLLFQLLTFQRQGEVFLQGHHVVVHACASFAFGNTNTYHNSHRKATDFAEEIQRVFFVYVVQFLTVYHPPMVMPPQPWSS